MSDHMMILRGLLHGSGSGPRERALALRAATERRVSARAAADSAQELDALVDTALLHASSGDLVAAYRSGWTAADLAQHVGMWSTEGHMHHLLATIELSAGLLVEAYETAERAFDLFSLDAAEAEAAACLHTKAVVAGRMGDTDQAIEVAEQCRATLEVVGRPDMVAIVLGSLADLLCADRAYDEAIIHGRRAEALAIDHVPGALPRISAGLGEALSLVGRWQEAAPEFDTARQVIRDRLVDANDELLVELTLAAADVTMIEGRAALGRGRYAQAVRLLDEAAAQMGVRIDLTRELAVLELVAEARKKAGDLAGALDARERCDVLFRRVNQRQVEMQRTLIRISEQAENSGSVFQTRVPGVERRAQGREEFAAFQELAVLVDARSGGNVDLDIVGDLAGEVARALLCSDEWAEQLRVAARLHDIGKIAIPDSVLDKSGPLTVEEFETVKGHASVGHRILASNSSPMFQMAAEVAQSHHEWWDGGGYPLGLSGEAIPLSGRIVAVADVYEALRTARSYKRAWEIDEAVSFIQSGSGAQFDPAVVDAFVSVIEAGKAGRCLPGSC